jgi:hypothetical protein
MINRDKLTFRESTAYGNPWVAGQSFDFQLSKLNMQKLFLFVRPFVKRAYVFVNAGSSFIYNIIISYVPFFLQV